MVDFETIYLKLPIFLQHVACSLEGWRIQRSRFGNSFSTLLHEAENRTFWSVEQIRAYRDQRLRTFIQHAFHTVPFYRHRFQRLGIHPNEIQKLEDLQRLPILTKEEVQDYYHEMVSEAVPKRQQTITHTSGTTGGGLRFATIWRSFHEQWATIWRYYHWHGIKLGTWCGYFGGRSVVPSNQKSPPFWRYNYAGKQILFSGYHMSPKNMQAYAEELKYSRPPWLHGYPSLLTLLATYIVETRFDIGYQIQWITIGAENLLTQQAKLIEKAFGVQPKQHYGLGEAVANISECEYRRLHVDEDFAAVEFIPNHDGIGYKIIGTNFTNLATPLLRYDTQDVVTLSSKTCPCGRPGRLIESIDGRKEDYVVLKNGVRLGRMDHIFKDLTHIREAQMYQKRPGELIIRVVCGVNYSENDEKRLIQEVRKRVGNYADILIEYTEKLERSRTGKLRFVVSEIKGVI
jgi:phenylacetate-CoA ligase